MTAKCIFCNIVKGNTDTVIEFENENLIIFKDIKPASDHHYLAIPKVHIESVKCLKADDKILLDNLESALKQLLASKDVDIKDTLFGFHWPPFISVKHLHMHAIAPCSKMSFIASCVFRPGLWFSKLDYVQNWLQTRNE